MYRGIISIIVLIAGIIPKGDALLKQLQPRDSILIADQIEYGFELDSVDQDAVLAFPDYSKIFGKDTLVLVENWKLDTLKTHKLPNKRLSYKLRGSIVLAPFEEGEYILPPVSVQYTSPDGTVDTLIFDSQTISVKTMPVDTATFEIHDIKGQMTYPVTFRELIPYILGFLVLAALIAGLVYFLKRRAQMKEQVEEQKEPPYLTALRKLEHYRSDKYWAPEKQKAFYSGITDTLRAYIASRFGIDAKEMTTAEIFAALKKNPDLTPDLYDEARELFETADFVKFAKHIVGDEENAKVVPAAVRFVTSTYQVTEEENVL